MKRVRNRDGVVIPYCVPNWLGIGTMAWGILASRF